MKKFTTLHSSEPTFSVSELNRQIQQLLEASLPWILVEGEISNLTRAASGHWYFSLKDDRAQIRCAMFKGKNIAVRFRPKDGDLVRVRARVTFYGPRGDCQLTIETMEAGGEGALQAAYERLKGQLQAEGLFDARHKKPLPIKPERVAIITSAAGAAVRDIIIAFRRRFPLTELTILPSLVQGEGAALNLRRQLERADSSGHFDAIIIGRGGGSLEDLWSFNDEALARAIFACQTPIVSAVGHEVDFAITDFVADARAATPTAAAEILSPDSRHLQQQVDHITLRLEQRLQQRLQQQQQRLLYLTQRLRHPRERLTAQQQRLNALQQRLQQAWQRRLGSQQMVVQHLAQRLERASVAKRIAQQQQTLAQQRQQLDRAMNNYLQARQRRFGSLIEKLDLVSPLGILSRGYAIATDKDQHVIRSRHDVQAQDQITVRLHDGSLRCDIVEISE
ncbi:exodeoxyribonuclease VII large subunit [Maribrevibacterium harenarium]|uniref:Exodeoxyribonuclease 7 large subunit n=1 Tax=Maribrevibacterium harenarium TaxID=2589817 RepID=A0A501X0P2_9GAMM|nr:exodeoxyribonuclease VII large subunit [Maribrevibacterium harenarium]TPE54167.1 exodeoxyribonuclease VII large subunit [Maribrevibacterium harenarium]